MLKLVKRPKSPYWIIRGSVGSRRTEKSTRTIDRKRAEVIRIKLESELLDRSIHGPGYTATFARAVNMYLDLGKDDRFINPLLNYFGKWRISEITPSAVHEAAQLLYPNASHATFNRQVIAPMSAIINHASKNGDLCPPIAIQRFKEKTPVRRSVSSDWIDRVMAQIEHLPHLRALVLFCALTGTRISDALKLRWSDVNISKGQVIFRAGKPDDDERVALAHALVVILANLPCRSDPVFKYASRWSTYRTLRRACKRAGVDYHAWHSLGRHTFARWLLDQGCSLKDLQVAGRWKSSRVVADIYASREQSTIDDLMRGLGENWGSDMTTTSENSKKTGT
jgi:integrase